MDGSIALCESLAKVLAVVVPGFTAPSGGSFLALMSGWLLVRGRHTLTNMIRAAGLSHLKHYCSFHRLLSKGVWEPNELWRLWATALVSWVNPKGDLVVLADDTLLKHRGPKVYGAGMFRNGVQSAHQYTAFHWGHQWVVLAVPIRFALWPDRVLSLPIFARLRGKDEPQTAVDRALEMLHLLRLWFPTRRIIFCGDGGYSSMVERQPPGVIVIVRIRQDAELFEVPAPRRRHQMGAPRVRGAKIPGGPKGIAASPATRWRRCQVRVGSTFRRLEYHRQEAVWSRHRKQPLQVLLVRDPSDPDKVEYFLCTERRLKPKQIIEIYGRRWSIELMFQDLKQHLGVEQPQVWTKRSVERAAPLGVLLYGAIVYWYARVHRHPASHSMDPWYRHKPHESFQDMLAAARQATWQQTDLYKSAYDSDTKKVLDALVAALSGAA